MPQEFQILQCCDCEKFQVHQVKKAKKWQCKVCGIKQTLKRAFFNGSGHDCRVNVQQMNFQVGEQEMKRKFQESCCSSLEDSKKDSVELVEDFDSSIENDWIGENNGFDTNEWVDENDWLDEGGFDEYPPSILNSSYNGNSQNGLEDKIPRKKQRRESSSESETVEDMNVIKFTEDEDKQGDFGFISALNYRNDKSSSNSINLTNKTSSNQAVAKSDCKQACDSVKDSKESLLSKSTTSVLKPTQGFQFILNEAKKQRTNLSYDLDW